MKLYEIPREIESLIDSETGEVTDFKRLAELQMERDAKVESLACAIKNLLSDADALKAEKDALEEREKACRAKAQKAKGYLEYCLAGEPFESPKCKISYRKSDKAEVLNKEDAFTFLRSQGYENAVKVSFDVNVAEAKKLLKQGVKVPGMQLVETMNMGVK